jgi:hypothetical protein
VESSFGLRRAVIVTGARAGTISTAEAMCRITGIAFNIAFGCTTGLAAYSHHSGRTIGCKADGMFFGPFSGSSGGFHLRPD